MSICKEIQKNILECPLRRKGKREETGSKMGFKKEKVVYSLQYRWNKEGNDIKFMGLRYNSMLDDLLIDSTGSKKQA